MWRIATILLIIGYANAACMLKNVYGVQMCTCNSTYCDSVPKIGIFTKSNLQIYVTSHTHIGFNLREQHVGDSTTVKASEIELNLDPTVKYQTIKGFGGAFTDATGQNLRRLTPKARTNLLESYFGEDGIGYSLCRVPIGGSDFSPRPYSYDDVDGDIHLDKFSLQNEDYTFKVSISHAYLFPH